MKLREVFYQLSTSPEKLAEVAEAIGADVDKVRRRELTVDQVNVLLVFLDYIITKKEGR